MKFRLLHLATIAAMFAATVVETVRPFGARWG
jgi:hypothetical protein